MRIAFILPSLANKGPIIATKNLVSYLIEHLNYIVDIYYFDDIVELKFGSSTTQIGFFENFSFNIYDVINSTGIRPDAYIFFHKYKIKCATISFLHNFVKEDLKMQYGKTISFIFSRIWNLLWTAHDRLISATDCMKSYYLKFLFNQRLCTLNYGMPLSTCSQIPINEIRILQRLKKNKFIIVGSIGLIIPRKGFKQLVHLLKHNSKVAVVIIGDGPQRTELERLAIKLKVVDRLFILGIKNSVSSYYNYFDIYALTSYSEGFSLAFIEALMQSIPVVFPNLAVYKEFLIPNYNNTYFNIDDIKSLSTTINKVYNNHRYFTAQSREVFEQFFTVEKMGKKYDLICRKLIQ